MKKLFKSISKCLNNLMTIDCNKQIQTNNKFMPINYGMGL